MDDVAEEIFNYLDYESLKCSEEVSAAWHNHILYSKTWEKLLARQVIALFLVLLHGSSYLCTIPLFIFGCFSQQICISPEWREVLDILMIKYPLKPCFDRSKDFYRQFCQFIGDTVMVHGFKLHFPVQVKNYNTLKKNNLETSMQLEDW